VQAPELGYGQPYHAFARRGSGENQAMEPRDDRDALGQAPDATVTSEELPARQRLARGWALVAGAAVAFVVVVLLLAWAI
jgi:hypothetical protein